MPWASIVCSMCMARGASIGHISNENLGSFAFWSIRVYSTLISNI